jgi:hypothetical protein
MLSWFSPSTEEASASAELLSALMLIPAYLNQKKRLNPDSGRIFNSYFDIDNMRHLLGALKKHTPDAQDIELAHTSLFLMYQMLRHLSQQSHLTDIEVIKTILDDFSRKVFKIEAIGPHVFKPGESLMTCITSKLGHHKHPTPHTVFFDKDLPVRATITINDQHFPLMLTPFDQPHRLLRPFEIAPC